MPAVLVAAVVLLTLPLDAEQARQFRAQSGQATESRFRGMDRNNDGVITRSEWRGSADSFKVHDWNNDGVLSGDEIRVGANRERTIEDEFAMATSADVADDDREDRFEYLDVNRNGRVERSEWHGSDDAFQWLDRNRDNVLTRGEVLGTNTAGSDRFAALDANGNGVISVDEWPRGRRAFDQRDTNRDGVLSRSEMQDARGNAVGTAGETVVVTAKDRWIDTGLDVQAGDMVTFDAQGTMQLSADGTDLAGPGGARSGRRAPDAPMRLEVAGGLIAKIGDAAPMFVGDRRTINRAPTAGRLYLGVNDDHLDDNTGEFRVTIAITRR